jgi:hypothetical protein
MENLETSNAGQQARSDNAAEPRRHWLGLPLAPLVEGTMGEVLGALPHFGRQPFAMASVNGSEIGINPYLDMIYRVPFRQGETPIPVGVVSKNYRLVDHHQVLLTVQDALLDSGVKPAEVKVRGEWTSHGERARFSVILPPQDRFRLAMASDDEMRFRIEIFNSVEGSCRLMAVAGWLRFVCSNGMIVGTALMRLKQQHRQQLQVEELGRLLRDAVLSTEADRITFDEWIGQPIDESVVVDWIDRDVHERWGVKAAVRVLGIISGGTDVEPAGDLRNRNPSEVETKVAGRVPGVNGPARDLFDVGQVLAWTAGQRTDVAEDLEWRSDVPLLVGKLAEQTSAARRNTDG